MHGTLHANLDLYKARLRLAAYPACLGKSLSRKTKGQFHGEENFMNAINSQRRIYSLAKLNYVALHRRLFNIRGENFRRVSIKIGGDGGGWYHYCPPDRGKFGVHKLPLPRRVLLCGPERAIICVMAPGLHWKRRYGTDSRVISDALLSFINVQNPNFIRAAGFYLWCDRKRDICFRDFLGRVFVIAEKKKKKNNKKPAISRKPGDRTIS